MHWENLRILHASKPPLDVMVSMRQRGSAMITNERTGLPQFHSDNARRERMRRLDAAQTAAQQQTNIPTSTTETQPEHPAVPKRCLG